eukprot:1157349-Pelagomonas_calceolata.AAC.4
MQSNKETVQHITLQCASQYSLIPCIHVFNSGGLTDIEVQGTLTFMRRGFECKIPVVFVRRETRIGVLKQLAYPTLHQSKVTQQFQEWIT